MRSHTIPFENRWTNGERAWEWSRELDRLGVPNVRAMFCDHEMHHGQESSVVSENSSRLCTGLAGLPRSARRQ